MEHIICTTIEQFNILENDAKNKWNELYPNGQCETYAEPMPHPISGSGLLAFPIEPNLGLSYGNSGVELDYTWSIPRSGLNDTAETLLEKRNEYIIYRRVAAYEASGLSWDAWSNANVQKELDEDAAEFDRLSGIREIIKSNYPKFV